MRRAAFCLLVSSGAAFAAEPPAVFWASSPVRPGERVLVQGGNFGEDARVRVGGVAVTPDFVSSSGLSFRLPPSAAPGEIAFSVAGSNGASRDYALNRPRLWWLQTPEGDVVEPGETFELFGENFEIPGVAPPDCVWLVAADGTMRAAPVLERTPWSVKARVPAGLSAGKRRIAVDNDKGRLARSEVRPRFSGEITVGKRRPFWKEKVFDATSFGAVPDDGKDDTAALRAAAAAAAANGGGVVFLPRGRFRCSAQIDLPRHTLLKGAGKDLTSLYWADMENPPEYLITGPGDFGVEDLFIHTGLFRNGIALKGDMTEKWLMASTRRMTAENVNIRRVALKLIVDQWSHLNWDRFLARYLTPGHALILRDVRNVVVEDVEIYAAKDASEFLFFNVTGENVRMTRTTVNGAGWAIFGGDRCVYEDGDARGCTFSISCVARNLCWRRNRQGDVTVNNRESVTHDISLCAFEKGTATGEADGRRLTLRYPDGVRFRENDLPVRDWPGYEIQIVEGKGVGQTRTIASAADRWHVEVDRPWDVTPDGTSRFSIGAERRHLLYLDNYIEDSYIGIQLYGGATEAVVARNVCRRTGGHEASGRDYMGVIPCWYVQFLENRIASGLTYRGGETDLLPGDAMIGSKPVNGARPYSQGLVVRGNALDNNARIRVNTVNALVEGNVLAECDVGVEIGQNAGSVFVASNDYRSVACPVAGPACAMPAAERRRCRAIELRAMLPGPWPQEPDANAWLALHNGETLDARAAGWLFGADFRFNLDGSGVRDLFQSDKAAEADVAWRLALASGAPPAKTVRLSAAAFGGWRFEPGGAQAAAFDGGVARGVLRAASPDGPKGGGFVPMAAELSGEGWRVTVPVRARTSELFRIPHWQVRAGRAAAERLSVDAPAFGSRSETLARRVLAGEEVSGRVEFEVRRPFFADFSHWDYWGEVRLDGKPLILPPFRVDQARGVFLEGGRHVLETIHRFPDRSTYRFEWNKPKTIGGVLDVRMTPCETVRPGDCVFLP